jgi:hypothetical protein
MLDDASTGTRWALVGVAFVLTAAASVLFNRLSKRMQAHRGPGYNDFQKLGSAREVREALDAWRPDELAAARKAWLLDLVYPAFYALLFALLASLGAIHADSLGWGAFSWAVTAVSSLAVAAGGVDLLVENPAVGVGLWGTPSDTAARVAGAAGKVEWFLLAVVLVALVVAGAAFLVETL